MKDIILITLIILALIILTLYITKKTKDEEKEKESENESKDESEDESESEDENESENESEDEDKNDEQMDKIKRVMFKIDSIDDEISKKLDDSNYNNGRNSGGIYRVKHNYINTKNKKYVVPEKYLDYTIIDGKNYTLGYPSTFAGCKLF
jgi:hypothetical protein